MIDTGRAEGTDVTFSPFCDDQTSAELAAYPRVAACAACHEYAEDQVAAGSPMPATLAATLAFHDSAHLEDYLTLASQHFG
jgi:hypothetical protein